MKTNKPKMANKLKINKRYVIHVAARNLGLLMRDLFKIGKPRVLQAGMEEESASLFACINAARRVLRFLAIQLGASDRHRPGLNRSPMIAVV